jgi:LysM repeat protein
VSSRDGSVQLAATSQSTPTPKKTLKAEKKAISPKATPKTPPSDTKLTTHTVRRGQTLAAIAQRYRTTVPTLKKLNQIKRANLIRSGQKLHVPATYVTHQVRRGQTLAAIAQRYGTTVMALKLLNQLKNAQFLQIGQTLRVPMS